MSNKRSITCVKEKNVMEHEKNFREVVRSENLQRDVAVSLEEMVVIIASFAQKFCSELPQNAQGAVPLVNGSAVSNLDTGTAESGFLS